MAINPETEYPGNITPSTPQYPFGKARNIVIPGDGTGTPWEAALLNDIFGFQQALLSAEGVVPSGAPDEVGASQYLESLKKRVGRFGEYAADSVTNMTAGKPVGWATVDDTVVLADGQRWKTGATTWLINTSDGVVLGGGLFARSITPRNSIDYGLSRNDIEGLRAAQDGSGDVNYTQFGSLHMANGIDSQSVFDFANFADQGLGGTNAIGFVYHHYTEGVMTQMDNVGEANTILLLKNANNSTRRPDKAVDFIGTAKFISLNRQESDGGGGVTGTLEGFYVSKDFELVWPMQATGVNTVRLHNNIAAASAFWTHEFKNTNEQEFLFRIDNGGTVPFSVQWFSAGQTIDIKSHGGIILRPATGDLNLSPTTGLVKSNSPHRNPVFSRAGLPTLTGGDVGAEAYLLDAADKYPIHWDGASWLKTSDNTAA